MPSRQHSANLPFLIACFGIALFSGMDAAMKKLTLALGAYNAMLWRLAVGALIGGAIFLISRHPLPDRRAVRTHLIRGTVAPFMATTFFYGIARVPIAEGIALSFIAPIIAIYLAAAMLGETVQKKALFASLLGLAGVLIILAGKWNGAGHHNREAWLGVVSVLFSAMLYAVNLVLQRQQALQSSPQEVMFFQHIIALGVMMLASPWLAAFPAEEHWPGIVLSATLAIAALGILSWAYGKAQAQIMVISEYTAFLWAALFGWIYFREQVTLAMLAGAIFIVAGCIIATRPDRQEMLAAS